MVGSNNRTAVSALMAIVGAVCLCFSCNCNSESSDSRVEMIDGQASYAQTDYGLAVSGQFTLAIRLDAEHHSQGEQSRIYLYRLQLGPHRHLRYSIEGMDWIEREPSANSLPHAATVGAESRLVINWSVTLLDAEPQDLCSQGLHAAIYLPLTDELHQPYLVAANGSRASAHQPLTWTPNPCE